MKRILSLVLVLCFVVALSACGKTGDKPAGGDTSSAPVSSVDGTTDASSDSTSSADTESTTESGGGSNTESGTSSSNPPVTDVLPFHSDLAGGAALAVSSQGTDGLTADRILNFLSYELFHSYFYESDSAAMLPGRYNITVAGRTFQFNHYYVPENVVFDVAAKYFVLNDALKAKLKSSDRYDSQNGTFLCTEPLWYTGIGSPVLAYDNLSNGEYNIYVKARIHNHPEGGAGCSDCSSTDSCVIATPLFKAKIKATSNKTFVYLDFKYIDSIPSSAIEMK